jgi:ethanolamine utilization protein EutP (predicted NTPase)
MDIKARTMVSFMTKIDMAEAEAEAEVNRFIDVILKDGRSQRVYYFEEEEEEEE